jgi:hypothetical protein
MMVASVIIVQAPPLPTPPEDATMPISETSRRAMYDAFHPLLGDEATDDMLSCFPTSHDELPASREFVRAEAAGLRLVSIERTDALGTELRAEMATLGTELRAEMATLGTELRGEMADLRTELQGEMADLRTELRAEMATLGKELRGEMAGLRTELRDEMAELRVGIEGAMRQQTMWLTGVLVAAAGVVGAAGVLG